MTKLRYRQSAVLAVLLVAMAAHAQVRPPDAADTSMLNRIWLEGTNNSRVMEHLSWITDVFGPRIPGSPAYNQAAAWAVKRFTELGLSGAAIEPAGEFGLGWSYEYVSAHMTAPSYMPIVAYPRPWTGSTKGKIVGSPVLAVISSKADMDKYRGKLKGAIVLVKEPRPVHPNFSAPATRLDDKGLKEIEETPIPVKPAKRGEPGGRRSQMGGARRVLQDRGGRLPRRGLEREPLGFRHGQGRRLRRERQGPRHPRPEPADHRGGRTIQPDLPHPRPRGPGDPRDRGPDDDPRQGHDGLQRRAEIPGTDKKDELVMLGGHLDSWTGGTGAVDDAAGCAVAMEALRILKAIGVKPRRTIRAAFWNGEEEGFYGSRGYVVRHFGDTDMQSLAKMDFEALDGSWRTPLGDSTKLLAKPEYAKLAGYYNYDNGSGRIRGIYIQENFAVRPIFEAWMKPLKDLGVTTIALQNTEGTDHLPFDYIGLPGFQFIQDPLDYFPGLHHTNQDVYDHAVPEDLVQSAIVMAYFVYQTAMREEMLPRKPLPIPVEMPVKGK